MNKYRIFIYTHKDFDMPCELDPNIYTILTERELSDTYNIPVINTNEGENINYKGAAWSEVKGLYYLYKHQELLPDFVGFCHYRRFFPFFNEIPPLSKYQCFGTNYFCNATLYIHYSIYHNINDFNICLDYIDKKYPEYRKALNNVFYNGHRFISNIIFVMSKEKFL